MNFDIETIGFDMGEIDLRIESLNLKDTSAAEPEFPDVPGPAITRVGDLWLIGQHTSGSKAMSRASARFVIGSS